MANYKIGITHWGMPGEWHYPVRVADKAGLDGIQLELGSYESGYPLAQKYIQEFYLEESAKYNIAFPSLALNDLCVNGFVNGARSEQGKIAYETMNHGIETAQQMNIDTIMVPNFFANAILDEKHFENTAEALIHCCDKALQYGITIASESSISPEEHFRLLDLVNRPNIGIFFDTMNEKFFGKRDQLDALKKKFPRMVPQIHVKDGVDHLSGAFLGEGDMDFFKQADYIAGANYSGWIILENYHSHMPLRGTTSVDQLQRLILDIAILKKAFSNRV